MIKIKNMNFLTRKTVTMKTVCDIRTVEYYICVNMDIYNFFLTFMGCVLRTIPYVSTQNNTKISFFFGLKYCQY